MSFPRYSKYKDSGVEWLGEVPEHWQVSRLKHVVANLASGGTPDTSTPRFWAEDEDQGIPWVAIGDMTRESIVRSTEKRTSPEGLAAKRLEVFPAGTLLYSMFASLGKVATLGVPATVNQAILGITPNESVLSGAYLRYWLGYLESHLGQFSSSNTQDNLNAGKVRGFPVAVPRPSEQAAIASFLDRETAKIDTLIAEEQRLIELLQEKRQAVISHAVTKGLNPDTPMKDSGIEWLGKVPDNWEVVPLKRLGSIRYGIGEPPKYNDDGTPLIRATNVRSGVLTPVGLVFVNPDEIPEQRIVWLDAGDIIVVRSGAGTGDSAIIPIDYGPAIAGFDMVLRLQRANAWFIQFVLLSKYVREGQIDVEKMRAAQPHLNAEELGGCNVVLPPEDEQAAIVKYLLDQAHQFDTLSAEALRAITLLQERRSALISAAVTGQIDVRGFSTGGSEAA